MFFSSSECITWLSVKMVESVAIVIVNVVTISICIKIRGFRLRNVIYLVINLAIADMIVGAFTVVLDFLFFGARFCSFWKYDVSTTWEHILIGMQWLFLLMSLTNIAAISLERMYATFRPIRYRIIKKWVYWVAIAVIWVLANAVSIGMVIISLNKKFFSHGWTKPLYLSQSFSFLCLFVIFVCYVSIAVRINCGEQQHGPAAMRERKLTVTLFIMTLVSLLMFLPFAVIVFLQTTEMLKSLSVLSFVRLNNAGVVLFYINSIVNPVLYAIRMPEFKRALASLFCCKPQRRCVVAPLPLMDQ